MSKPLKPHQMEVLRGIEAGAVGHRNFGTGAWRVVGAEAGVVAGLVRRGLARNNWPNGYSLTDAGRAALKEDRP